MADYARGEQLRDLRERQHKSQEFVAAEIGVSTKTLRAWEHGGKIRWDNAKRLGSFYGQDPETLVARDMSEPSDDGAGPPSQLDRIEANTREILRLLKGADDVVAELEALPGRVEAAAGKPRRRASGRSAKK